MSLFESLGLGQAQPVLTHSQQGAEAKTGPDGIYSLLTVRSIYAPSNAVTPLDSRKAFLTEGPSFEGDLGNLCSVTFKLAD